ncbi:L-amino-acid oxidase-like [Xenia sp. Carnegie-2017]|uniref:L-amino-acid oxidase-like n=1 Tax=Xenia sp. Carnegie-2017 TaxID=2897299 RepID=UPI001F04824A|nr:L-amino-acid oxidase-like [Xenia sp. Carnegie-2017]
MASEYLKTRKRFWENDNSLKRPENNQVPIQLSELIKTFLKCIQEEGLQTAYNRYRYNPRETQLPRSVINATEDEKISDVIIVGAGMAGLSAAYELKRAGLSVTVLEQTDRYGGRIFTYGKESGLASGLFAEVGAMRFPGDANDQSDRPHFLADGYIKSFNLSIKPFPNFDKNVITCIYGFHEKSEVWAEKHFDNIWPNWKEAMNNALKDDVLDVEKYYDETIGAVTDQLYTWLSK